MARIYKTPTKEQLYNELDDTLKTTLNKMLEIQNILINNPPNDKKFNNKQMNYFIEYSNILFQIENDNAHYTDDYIINAINNLYDKVFKNRRY